MTKDEIIRMAREAGGGLSCIAEPLGHPWKFSESELMRFAALVAAAEREACAKLVDDMWTGYGDLGAICSAAIRARGQE